MDRKATSCAYVTSVKKHYSTVRIFGKARFQKADGDFGDPSKLSRIFLRQKMIPHFFPPGSLEKLLCKCHVKARVAQHECFDLFFHPGRK
jgi:hypothetical protein